MLLSVIRLILKTSLVTPDFFTFLNYFYHFLPAVKVLKKYVRGNFWVRTSLNGSSTFTREHFVKLLFFSALLLVLKEWLSVSQLGGPRGMPDTENV